MQKIGIFSYFGLTLRFRQHNLNLNNKSRIRKGKISMAKAKTPWQKVAAKFALTPSALAAELKRHRSKIFRALRDEHGLINGRDQLLLLQAARRRGVSLTPSDMTPEDEDA